MLYNLSIEDGNKNCLWRNKTPILPRVGDTIKFRNYYKVIKVVLHWLSMTDGCVDVTIIAEKEA